MKKLEGLIKSASCLTVLVLSLFYIFAVITGFAAPYIDFGMFALIFLFSLVIAVANLILGIKKYKLPLRIFIHYITLLIAFIFVFIFAGKLSAGGPEAILISVIIFTLLYAVIFTISYFTIKAVRAADERIDKSRVRSNAEQAKKKNSNYKPRYK